MNLNKRLKRVARAVECEKPDDLRERISAAFLNHFLRTDAELRRMRDECFGLICDALNRQPDQPPPYFFPTKETVDRQALWWRRNQGGNFCVWLYTHDAAFAEATRRILSTARERSRAHPQAKLLFSITS
jgi:hypothetical protein